MISRIGRTGCHYQVVDVAVLVSVNRWFFRSQVVQGSFQVGENALQPLRITSLLPVTIVAERRGVLCEMVMSPAILERPPQSPAQVRLTTVA